MQPVRQNIYHALQTALSVAALACAAPAASPPAAPTNGAAIRKDTVDFVVLGRGPRIDCEVAPPDARLCRLRHHVTIAEIRSRLAGGTNVWREDDALIFAHEGEADAVDVVGALHYPMSRVRRTDLWILKLHIQDLDHAVLSYAFVPTGRQPSPGNGSPPGMWRGAHAPPKPAKTAHLQGRVALETVHSRALGAARELRVYVPPGSGAIDGTIYMGDGEMLGSLAPYLDTLIVAGTLPRVMLVGITGASRQPGDPPRSDPRALEYLWNYDTLNTRFLAHERFLLEEVMPWAESRHGAPVGREQRAVFGVSNSGGWAIQMGLRNPERVAHIIAFSPGGVRTGHTTPSMRSRPPVRFMLLNGTLDTGFEEVARVWTEQLTARKLELAKLTVVAGHDPNVWAERFGSAVQWAFGPDTR